MNQPGHEIQHTPTWEKIVGFFGVCLIGIGFVYLGWAAVTENGKPPEIGFSITEINDLNGQFLVQIEVRNTGLKSVAALDIEGHLNPSQGEDEISNATVDYIPSRSTRRVGLFFTQDPRLGKLELTPVGYQEP